MQPLIDLGRWEVDNTHISYYILQEFWVYGANCKYLLKLDLGRMVFMHGIVYNFIEVSIGLIILI